MSLLVVDMSVVLVVDPGWSKVQAIESLVRKSGYQVPPEGLSESSWPTHVWSRHVGCVE